MYNHNILIDYIFMSQRSFDSKDSIYIVFFILFLTPHVQNFGLQIISPMQFISSF